jgi:hypothetical protein
MPDERASSLLEPVSKLPIPEPKPERTALPAVPLKKPARPVPAVEAVAAVPNPAPAAA